MEYNDVWKENKTSKCAIGSETWCIANSIVIEIETSWLIFGKLYIMVV